MMNNQDQMPPEDRRNFIIFIVTALAIWFGFDQIVLQPRLEAMQIAQQQAQEAMELQTAGQSPETTLIDLAPRPRAEILDEGGARLPLGNDLIAGSLSLQGGRIDDVHFLNHFETLEKKETVVLLSPAGSEYPRYADLGWIAADKNTKIPDAASRWRVAEGDLSMGLTPQTPITLFWDNGKGLRFERLITMDENFLLTITQRVVNKSGKTVTLYPYSLIAQHGMPKDLFGRYIIHEGPIGYFDNDLVERSYKKSRKEPLTEQQAQKGWIGITDRYWYTGLFPSQEEDTKFRMIYSASKSLQDRERFQTDMTGEARTISTGAQGENTVHLFIGAKELGQISAYEKQLGVPHFDLVLDFGMYYFLTKPFFYILEFFGNLMGNMGLALIALTVLVRLAVFPLANKSFKSFARLREIAPVMNELREKHKDDKQKLQESLVKLYEKEKVNPMAGCFPILIQIPIFFALFKVLQIAIEMRHAPFFGWIHDLSAPDPTSLFNLFGLMPWETPGFLPEIGVWPILMLLFMLLQRQLNPPPQDKTQAMMMNIMPFFMCLILAGFASGLVIYWTFSNALSIVQQYVIMRMMGVEVHLFKRSKADKDMAEKVAEGPTVHPKLEMIKEDVEDALFDDDDDNKDESKKAKKEDKKPKKPISKPKPKKKKKK